MKLVIVCVFLALGGIQLADCIKCIGSRIGKASYHTYKDESMKGVESHCKSWITKCYVDYYRGGETREVLLDYFSYGCGACRRAKYCKDCMGDNCNKASHWINDLERDLVPCLHYISVSIEVRAPEETFCYPSEKCLKLINRKQLSKTFPANTTIISCSNFLKVYNSYPLLERYECRPNAEKTDCIKLHHITNAWHPNWLLVAVLLGCTMMIAILIALLIKFWLKKKKREKSPRNIKN